MINRPLESVFTYIYANNSWGHPESVSGHGSSLAKTVQIRKEIPFLLRKYKIRSVFDAPCGDLNWMKELDLSNVEYIGGDIVQALVRKNKKRYKNFGKKFVKINVISVVPPKSDLILCRDLLIHLPLKDCKEVVNRFIESGSKYLLTTTYIHHPENLDIKPGAWRPVNLKLPPFFFPEPLQLIEDGDADPNFQDYGKHLGLWLLSDIAIQCAESDSVRGN